MWAWVSHSTGKKQLLRSARKKTESEAEMEVPEINCSSPVFHNESSQTLGVYLHKLISYQFTRLQSPYVTDVVLRVLEKPKSKAESLENFPKTVMLVAAGRYRSD